MFVERMEPLRIRSTDADPFIPKSFKVLYTKILSVVETKIDSVFKKTAVGVW